MYFEIASGVPTRGEFNFPQKYFVLLQIKERRELDFMEIKGRKFI